MEEKPNQNEPASADTTKQYEPWQPKSESSNAEQIEKIGDEDVAEIKKILIAGVAGYASAHFSMPLEPEFKTEHSTKTSAQSIETREKVDFVSNLLVKQDEIILMHMSQELSSVFIELHFGVNQEYKLGVPERTAFGDFEVAALSAMSKDMFAQCHSIATIAYDTQEEKMNTEINCYHFQMHFKNQSDQFFINFVLSEKVIMNYIKSKKRGGANSKKINLDNTLIEIRAKLFESYVDLNYIMNMAVDGLIPIDSKDKVILEINGRNISKGALGAINHQKAIKISTLSEAMDKLWQTTA
jgi:hypothetical protein